jgi:alpha-galactosidase
MLGMDLRRMEKGDALHKIVSNEAIIALNQDALGVQAKRILATKMTEADGRVGTRPNQAYVRDNDRIDVLAKPLADGSVALSFFNLSQQEKKEAVAVDVARIVNYLREKMVRPEIFEQAKSFTVTNLWTGETTKNETGSFGVTSIEGCGDVTLKVTPNA